MGKTIISQARGHGSKTYRVRPNAYKYKISYPPISEKNTVKIMSIINSPAHSAPLAKIVVNNNPYYIPAIQGIFEGQEIEINTDNVKNGNIVYLKDIPIGTKISNIEIIPGDGGKMIRTSGGFAVVIENNGEKVIVSMINKKQKTLDGRCRAIIGEIAGQGRIMKPLIKAGKKYYMMKARNKLWPRTSAVKVNAVDHPFGGGRGKRIKSKIAKKFAPPGAKVGHILPRRTGVKK